MLESDRAILVSARLAVVVLSAATFLFGPRSATAADDPVGIQNLRLRILIAFTSFRDDDRYANVFRYELSPTGEGKITGKIAPGAKRSDHHPSLSGDGKRAVFAGEVVGEVNQIHAWDFEKVKPASLPSLNITATAQMAPSFVSQAPSDGLIAFEAWKRPTGSGRWDVFVHDVAAKSYLDLPGLNTARFDERKPALSSDKNWIAFTTNERVQVTLTDIRLYDRQNQRRLELPGLNSDAMDTEPALNRDGRFVAFISDREGGAGARDVYLYDRVQAKLLPLPGLNTIGQEQSPSLSADGRFIAFVSERLDGAGERDIYLYDRETQKLIPTPGLNSAGDEYDPCIVLTDS